MKTPTLISAQKRFAHCLSLFILKLIDSGYSVTFGETYRPLEMAKIYAEQGKGIVNSLHVLKLAADLNVFDKHGKFLTTKDELEFAGKLWKGDSQPDIECAWGGDFKRVDANHFSFRWDGRA